MNMLIAQEHGPFVAAALEAVARRRNQDEPSWLADLREQAAETFRDRGLPGPRDEEWKYTRLKRLDGVEFSFDSKGDLPDLSEVVAQHRIEGAQCLVLADGRYVPEYSDVSDSTNGVRVRPISDAIATMPELTGWFGRCADHTALSLTALNTAMFQDGALVLVPDGCDAGSVIQVIHIGTGRPATAAFPRNLYLLGKGSRAVIVEVYAGMKGGPYFVDLVSEALLGDEASLEHYKLVHETDDATHVANLAVEQGARSQFVSHYAAMSGGLVRNEIRTRFAGSHGNCTLNGLYLGEGKSHLDAFTTIDHAVPECESHEHYKGLLDGKSHGVFTGRILVRPHAQKTDAKQTNQCVLLSDDAMIDTRPQLEIFADDVKCTHGATVGQLDENAMFYLRSRGLSYEQARRLLIFAFANEVLSRMSLDEVRLRLESALVARHGLPTLTNVDV